jgi:hypothetical protein
MGAFEVVGENICPGRRRASAERSTAAGRPLGNVEESRRGAIGEPHRRSINK